MDIGFNVELLKNFLHYNKVEEKDIQAAESIFKACDKFDCNGRQKPDGMLTGFEISSFISSCMQKLPHIGHILYNFAHPQPLTKEEAVKDRQILEDKVIDTYTEARGELIKQLKNGDFEYTDPNTGEKVSAKNLIKYLENMTFDSSIYGAAHALKEISAIDVNTTPSDGTNIPISWMYNETKEGAMKILLHEALHCTYPKNWAVQKEEMFVESNAIKLMAQIIENSNGQVRDLQIPQYGESVLELAANDEHLESVLQERFINNGYQHRIKNEFGDVNIEGHEIKGDDTVYINGEEAGCIGSDFFLDELAPNMIKLFGNPGPGGDIYMSEQEGSIPVEVKNEKGEIVLTAYLVPAKPIAPSIKFQNKNGDSISIKNGDTIKIDGKSYCIGKDGVELKTLDGFRGQLAIIREEEEPELISTNLIFNSVPPDEDKKDDYAERQYKDFIVTDRNGRKYIGRMY